jgi:hypothetical protein
MYTNKIRHWAVALGLVAVAGITGASAAGYTHHGRLPAGRSETLPVPSGDLGEVIVHAPGDLGEVIVHAPRDLGEVLVNVHREPVEGAYLAHVIVTVPREGSAVYTHVTEAAATLAAVQ